MDDVIVGGWGLVDRNPPVKTFPEGRRCQKFGCGTCLSIYNDGRFCALHHRPVTRRMRGVA
jgi:hypothetical protein